MNRHHDRSPSLRLPLICIYKFHSSLPLYCYYRRAARKYRNRGMRLVHGSANYHAALGGHSS